MDLRASVVGLFVGILVGVTGMGGGAVLTPVLILFGWARPMVAVGTDLLWSTLTKSVGALAHYRQNTVDMKIVKRLAVGSIPGALAGLGLLAHLHRAPGDATDRIIVRMLGITLVIVALSLLAKSLFRMTPRDADDSNQARGPVWLTSVVGAVVGFLVSLTSVGSGSLIVACLVVIYPATPLRRIVGSDILHALFLVGVSALGHVEMGSVDPRLLAGLLLGSLPGVWLGSKMTAALPDKVLRPMLAGTLFFLGYKLL